MKLYHFTSEMHLESILGDQYLKTVESNISAKREHAGPDVVWLTTHETADAGLGLQGSNADAGAIRFTVDVEKRSVHPWLGWARAHGSYSEIIAQLAQAGGSNFWRVVTERIHADQWVEVRNMLSGQVLLDHDTIMASISVTTQTTRK